MTRCSFRVPCLHPFGVLLDLQTRRRAAYPDPAVAAPGHPESSRSAQTARTPGVPGIPRSPFRASGERLRPAHGPPRARAQTPASLGPSRGTPSRTGPLRPGEAFRGAGSSPPRMNAESHRSLRPGEGESRRDIGLLQSARRGSAGRLNPGPARPDTGWTNARVPALTARGERPILAKCEPPPGRGAGRAIPLLAG